MDNCFSGLFKADDHHDDDDDDERISFMEE